MKGQLSQSIEWSLNRRDPFSTSVYRRVESKLKINMHQMQQDNNLGIPSCATERPRSMIKWTPELNVNEATERKGEGGERHICPLLFRA